MSIVGIIANPASGKDIRRLVGHALVVSNRDKVNIVTRIIIGLAKSGVEKVLIMPDRFGIGQRAMDGVKKSFPDIYKNIEIIPMLVVDSGDDTTKAAALMRKNGARAIIILGGDGTVRVAAKGSGQIPLLPISTGTNNVIPTFIEGTIAGLAAGKFVSLSEGERVSLARRQKKIAVYINGEYKDLALVDLVAADGMHIGSRAVWDAQSIRQIVVTQADITKIGFSNIIANYEPVKPEAPYGVAALILKEEVQRGLVEAVIGPGMISRLFIEKIEKLKPDERWPMIAERPLVLALDGEREYVLRKGDSAFVKISLAGPYFINIKGVLEKSGNKEN